MTDHLQTAHAEHHDAPIGSAGGFAVMRYGYMIKSPPLKRINQPTLCRWRRRYFILRKNKRLEYWSDSSQRELKGCVDLREVWQIEEDVDYRGQPTFCLSTHDRKYFFIAGDASDKRAWLTTIREVIGKSTSKSSSTPASIKDTSGTSRSFNTSSHRGHTNGRLSAEGDKPPPPRRFLGSNDFGGSVDYDSEEDEQTEDTFQMVLNPLREAVEQTDNEESNEFKATYNGDPIILRIVYPNLEMCSPETKRMIQYWPITALRGYSQDDTTFQIEAGRRCPGGEGFFKFALTDGGNVSASLASAEANHSIRRESMYGTVGRKF
ncbi:hypothetical protein PTSG_10106 [Salpingoeca rosetta]|uniref:PH domain-containing protein n=1 Tax=Salpingoeca rosetta (strain ATCC 50818 / BSB-021) TaxID=946362 RepID=F2UPI1_SALR5|nr:uncharacterized protein PTSG_10106 [Salpingoeca rosetta]EGD79536.1 hypothetical protein PTSG_10106 [Salpingoeca rosetta]|eukprot:XP_004989017.1 hypothetical protein PTSG_10106 [Salpingoeca rosetta]